RDCQQREKPVTKTRTGHGSAPSRNGTLAGYRIRRSIVSSPECGYAVELEPAHAPVRRPDPEAHQGERCGGEPETHRHPHEHPRKLLVLERGQTPGLRVRLVTGVE